MTIAASARARALQALKQLSLVRARVERIDAFYETKRAFGHFDTPINEEHYWEEEDEELGVFLKKAYLF